MQNDARKAAIRACKERKAAIGLYVVRCVEAGQIWIGRTMNLDTAENRVRFELRHGSSRTPSLQTAWASHGDESLVFETLERLDEDRITYGRDAFLKDRIAFWKSKLAAIVLE